MSNSIDYSKPETGTTTKGILYKMFRNDVDALRSMHSSTSFFSSAINGMFNFITNNLSRGQIYIYLSSWVDIAKVTERWRTKDLELRASHSLNNANFINITTNMTALTGGVDGEEVIVRNGKSSGSVTITNGANFKLAGATNFVMNAGAICRLVLRSGVWYETGRRAWS